MLTGIRLDGQTRYVEAVTGLVGDMLKRGYLRVLKTQSVV